MWRRNAATIIAGGLLAILLVVYMSTYQVRFHEVAIVKTLGKITHIETSPGLRACWPWPIQQVVKYDLRVNVLEDPLSEPLTQGGKPVTARAFMAWRIKKPELFLTNIGSEIASSMDDSGRIGPTRQPWHHDVHRACLRIAERVFVAAAES